MVWVIFAWVVAVGLAVILVLTAGLGVWRSVKTLTTALGEVGAHAAAAADELASVSASVGPSTPAGHADTARPGTRATRGPGRTMSGRRRPPVGRGR